MEAEDDFMPIYVDEANNYHIGQVLPADHPYAGAFIRSIRRTAKDGPLARRYMIDWSDDSDGTQGTFVSWK